MDILTALQMLPRGMQTETGRRENNAAITFPDASGGDWGTVSHFSLWDDTVFYADGTLTTSRNIVDGTSSIQFAAGDLGVEIPSS